MLNLHPTGKSFWMPIANAVAAFVFGFLVGWLGGVNAMLYSPSAAGGFVGAVLALIVWLHSHFTWLAIIRDSYHPISILDDEPEDEGDAGLLVTTTDRMEGIYIQPPCSDLQLKRFAVQVLNGRPPTYPNFTGDTDKPFTIVEFSDFRNWLCDRGYANKMKNDTIEINETGMRLLQNIAAGNLSPIRGLIPAP